MKEKEYQTLFAGIVRQKGDEVRKKEFKNCWNRGFSNYTGNDDSEFDWHPVSLLGHAILQSDLMIAEFRRPL